MKNYLDLLARILAEGTPHTDRTGVGTRRIFGAMLEFDLTQGFPVDGSRTIPWRSAIGEMCAFINGANKVSQFEAMGCKFWKANADGWQHPMADGEELGAIYGVQSRRWASRFLKAFKLDAVEGTVESEMQMYDQLAIVLSELKVNPDSRRLLVTHWRPDQLMDMALPPCHVQYQFLCDKDKGELSLKFDMRSTDMVLGAPNNIVGYAFLLEAVSKAFGYTAKKLIMTMADCHIYNNHIEGVQRMLTRPVPQLPKLVWMLGDGLPTPVDGHEVHWLEDLRPTMLRLDGYFPGDPIKFEMAV
jgi:thymidylate synthase